MSWRITSSSAGEHMKNMHLAGRTFRLGEPRNDILPQSHMVAGRRPARWPRGTIVRAIGYLESDQDFVVWEVVSGSPAPASGAPSSLLELMMSRIVTLFLGIDPASGLPDASRRRVLVALPGADFRSYDPRFPHVCRRCGGPAYEGAVDYECSDRRCRPYVRRLWEGGG